MISVEQVKELREKTGAGMMDCKRALTEAGGDMEKAMRLLRERGMAAAQKKAGRATTEGIVEAYVHGQGRIGVLIEVLCETDFVARNEEFRRLVHELAMQVAAANPRWVRREEVPAEVVAEESAIYRSQAEREGKSPQIVERIVQGRLEKFYRETCLLEQAYIRDPDRTVGEVVAELVARVGENITVRRFARFEVGEGLPRQEAC